MLNKDFFVALNELEDTKGIKKEDFINWLETALVVAYKKNFGEGKDISVKLDADKNKINVYAFKTVVKDDEIENEDLQIALSKAKEIKKSSKVGDILKEEITPKDFGRIAVGTAKQVVTQKLREAERSVAYKDMSEKLEHPPPRRRRARQPPTRSDHVPCARRKPRDQQTNQPKSRNRKERQKMNDTQTPAAAEFARPSWLRAEEDCCCGYGYLRTS